MRKTSRIAAQAFIAGSEIGLGNTTVVVDGENVRMYLFGNLIAERCPAALRITLAGWPTPTTRDRLNALLELLHTNKQIFQQDKAQYIGSTISPTACEITAHEWLRV